VPARAMTRTSMWRTVAVLGRIVPSRGPIRIAGGGRVMHIAPPLSPDDWRWLADIWRREWGGETVVTKGHLHRLTDLLAVIAWNDDTRVGAATFALGRDACELISANSMEVRKGIGTALLRAVEAEAQALGCQRIRLTITNDNLDALRYYQKQGYRLTRLYPGGAHTSRMLKTEAPAIGRNGIPIRDELEMEKELCPPAS
jgi:GNAT superfamily N-acetyltransferase